MKYWKTKTGEKLLIKDMETSHIENCIKMLERKLSSGDVYVAVGGGWEADEYWGDEIDISEDIKDCIKTFKKELKRRSAKVVS